MKPVKIIEVRAPEYNLRTKPDYARIGRKVDSAIVRNLPDGRYIYRVIGKRDHPKLSLGELVSTIARLGTDRYDPKRREVCFEDFRMYDHDIHAGSFSIKGRRLVLNGSYDVPSVFGDDVKKFYENALLDRGYRVRLDVMIIYRADRLTRAEKVDRKAEGARPEIEECLYKFKDPGHKREALAGIVKILR